MTKKIPKRERLYGEKYGSRGSTGMRRGHKVVKAEANPNFIHIKLTDHVPTYHTSRAGVKYTKYQPLYEKREHTLIKKTK